MYYTNAVFIYIMTSSIEHEENDMKTSVVGYPRIGTLRELKFALEKYFKNEINADELEKTAKELRKTHWFTQKDAGIDYITSNDFSYYDMEKESIRKKCAKQLKLAVERESAKRSPADYSGYPIVLTDSYVKEFLKFYLMRSNAAYVYPGYSDYKEGYDIMSDISIEGVPEYPYSAEGVKTVSRMIIEHGIVKNIHGNVMHLSYLNRPYIGMYENLHCVCNGEPMDRLLNGKYILVKNFSDFQMDPLTGDFGGEFRLAEISDENGKRIVTGGTVTGNILKNADKIRYSGEYFKEGLYVGPSAVKIG